MKWYKKFLVIPAILSILSNWILFYYCADESTAGGAEIRGDLYKSLLAQFYIVDVPFELWEQIYNWPFNTFQIFFVLFFLATALFATKTGSAFIYVFTVVAASARNSTRN